MNKESSDQIEEIKKKHWRYYKKASICKFAMKKHECWQEYAEAVEFCKLAIHYEQLIKRPLNLSELEINGLKGHLRYIKRKIKT